MGFIDDARINAQDTLASLQTQSGTTSQEVQRIADEARRQIDSIVVDAKTAIEQKINELNQAAEQAKQI